MFEKKILKNFHWIITIITVLMLMISPIIPFLKLNKNSINIIKDITSLKKQKHYPSLTFENDEFECHYKWLDTIHDYQTYGLGYSLFNMKEMINCSFLHVKMIRKIAPERIDLAEKAAETYPNKRDALFWFAERLAIKDIFQAEPFVIEILNSWPEDWEAWRLLAIKFEKQGLLEDAIVSNIKSCEYSPYNKVGCYYAGILLEKQFRFDEAIFYYRIATNRAAIDRANILEAQLSNPEGIP